MNPRTPQAPADFAALDEYASYTPVGVVSLDEAVSLMTQAIFYAREQRIGRLVINALKLTGFPAPSLPQRYWIARGFAAAAAEVVSVAFVLEPHLIDPGRFGVVVAWNLAMRAEVFTELNDATTWLLSNAPPPSINLPGSEP